MRWRFAPARQRLLGPRASPSRRETACFQTYLGAYPQRLGDRRTSELVVHTHYACRGVTSIKPLLCISPGVGSDASPQLGIEQGLGEAVTQRLDVVSGHDETGVSIPDDFGGASGIGHDDRQ